MTLLETCRQYNSIVKKMRDAAHASDWDRLLLLDQDCRPYIETLQVIDRQAFDAAADESVRVLIGETAAYYADISALVNVHRNEIKAALAVDSITSKLSRLYGF